VDAKLFGGEPASIDSAVSSYCYYVAAKLKESVPLNAMTKHKLGLFNGKPGARQFRRHLSESATKQGADIGVLRDALSFLDAGRNAA
jgi:tRNA-dihydrouridine synthase A